MLGDAGSLKTAYVLMLRSKTLPHYVLKIMYRSPVVALLSIATRGQPASDAATATHVLITTLLACLTTAAAFPTSRGANAVWLAATASIFSKACHVAGSPAIMRRELRGSFWDTMVLKILEGGHV